MEFLRGGGPKGSFQRYVITLPLLPFHEYNLSVCVYIYIYSVRNYPDKLITRHGMQIFLSVIYRVIKISLE